ncbi:MAG: carbohydrate ABC transporter permease, partial [Candidatus Zixiibacteriota bacterium]
MKARKASGLLLVSPWLLTFGLFWLFPLAYSFVLGFTDLRLLAKDFEWVGLSNYRSLLSDPDFILALKNTCIFVLGSIPVTTVVSLTMAMLVNRRFKLRELFRAGYFLPWITSMVVVALIFNNFFKRGGYVAYLAEMIGLQPPEYGFLYDSGTALYSIMAMDVWMSVGYYMLVFLAGLKSIPDELYEAAEINGASPMRQLFSITLPMLRPVAFFILLINNI